MPWVGPAPPFFLLCCSQVGQYSLRLRRYYRRLYYVEGVIQPSRVILPYTRARTRVGARGANRNRLPIVAREVRSYLIVLTGNRCRRIL